MVKNSSFELFIFHIRKTSSEEFVGVEHLYISNSALQQLWWDGSAQLRIPLRLVIIIDKCMLTF